MFLLCLQPRLEARLRQHHLLLYLQEPGQLPFLQRLHHRKSLLRKYHLLHRLRLRLPLDEGLDGFEIHLHL